MRLVESEGRTLIQPFDDPLVIAGQGTIGLEILKEMNGKKLDAIVRGLSGRLSGLRAFHSKSVSYGVFVWARRAFNRPKWRFLARAGHAKTAAGGVGRPELRLLAVAATADSPAQYVPFMNAVFAAQKLGVTIEEAVKAAPKKIESGRRRGQRCLLGCGPRHVVA